MESSDLPIIFGCRLEVKSLELRLGLSWSERDAVDRDLGRTEGRGGIGVNNASKKIKHRRAVVGYRTDAFRSAEN